MKFKLLSILLVLITANTFCGKQACDGTGPCNYLKYSDVPGLMEKDKYCKYTVVKRIDCSFGFFALNCNDLVCVECVQSCPLPDSTDAVKGQYLFIKYNKDDYVLKLNPQPTCSMCTVSKIHIYKDK